MISPRPSTTSPSRTTDSRSHRLAGSSRRRKVVLFSVAFLLALLGAIYFAVDPAESTFLPRCLFYALTGWKCPGCGSQRMIHALLHGDVASAMAFNPFLLIAIPVIILLIVLEFKRTSWPRLYANVYSLPGIGIMAGIVFLWWLMRNILGI